MPSEVRRLHPLTPFFDLLSTVRQFALPLVLALFANRDRGQLALLAPTLLFTLGGAAKWWRFTYTFDGARLVIDEGVLTRKQRIVPVDRIQQVDMATTLRHRLLGVTVLKLETAGGTGAAEVSLSVVSTAEAARLRSVLLPAGPRAAASDPAATDPEAPAPVPRATTLLQLGPGRLALAGVTGSELAVMFTILLSVGQLVDDLPESLLLDRVEDLTTPSDVAGFTLAGIVAVALWFALAASASVLKDGRYRLVRRGDQLAVSRGLLDQREASIPLHRVQVVRIQQAFVRKLLGRSSLRIRSSAGAIEVPLVTAAETTELLRVVLPRTELSDLIPAPSAARRRAILRRVIPALLVLFGSALWLERAVPFAAIVVALSVLLGELAYRGLAHGWNGGVAVARSGGLRREITVVPGAKAQSTRLRTSPLQRRAGLATLYVDVATSGTSPAIRDGDLHRLADLQAAISSTPAARTDEIDVRRRSPLVLGGSTRAEHG